MEELKLERISDDDITRSLAEEWKVDIKDIPQKAVFKWFYIIAKKQLQADQQVVDKLKAEITSKDKGIELLNASIKCFESAIEEYKQEKKEIFTTTKSIICGLCYRLNPQHKDMDYGKGCKHCKEIDDIERKLNI